jgi:hypothetical protein
MRPSPISILLDSNERGSDRAKALALAVGGDPAYELAGLAILMSKISPRRIEKLEEEIKLLHNSRCGAHQVNPALLGDLE